MYGVQDVRHTRGIWGAMCTGGTGVTEGVRVTGFTGFIRGIGG